MSLWKVLLIRKATTIVCILHFLIIVSYHLKLFQVIYWLAIYLKQRFNFVLGVDDLAAFKQEHGEEKLWEFGGESSKALSLMVRSRAFLAGFPDKYFSFHSLRAGIFYSIITTE